MGKKILISDKVHPSLIDRLRTANFLVDYQPGITLEEVKKILPGYQGVIINSKIKMDAAAIDSNPNLEFIARLGSGMEIVNIPYARKKSIRVINAPEGNSNAVGEQAMGMLLMLANNLIRCNNEVKNFQWNREKNRGFELKGKTIGIIGVGHTGRSLAKKLQGWETTVLGYDKYVKGYGSELGFIKETSLEEIKEQADIISFHLPLNEETKHMCDDAFLESCSKRIIIINTSRGIVVKTVDLIKHLSSGKVIGACLDVFENEKVQTYSATEEKMYRQLFSFDNVVVSPHVAGWTHESLKGIADLVFERIVNGYSMEVNALYDL
jgi:D-3-phosphoglycerate dehydrogenase